MTSFVLEIPYKDQIIILTETDTKPLKSEISLNLKERFELNISWEDGIERIMKFFGNQDIEIGFSEFDEKYLIQSNNSEKTVGILTNLKDLILKLNIYLISLRQENSQNHKLIITKDRNTIELIEMIDFIELNFKLIDNLAIN